MDDTHNNKKIGLAAYILVGLAGIGMLFIGVPFFVTSQSNAVAKVNGTEITQQQLGSAISNIQQSDNAASQQQLRTLAMRQLIAQTLLNQYAGKSGLRYPDKALYAAIKRQFVDTQRYRSFLQEIGMDAISYEKQLRMDLAAQAYYSMIARAQYDHPSITDVFINNIAQQRDFTVVRLPITEAVQDVSISDKEIGDYYAAHQQELVQPEQIALNYILFDLNDLIDPKAITDAALAKAREQMGKAGELRSGEYFLFTHEKDATQAEQRLKGRDGAKLLSQDIDGNKIDGEHGQFNLHLKGEGISTAADDALFSLAKTGDVSPVFKTDYGYMVVIAGQIQPPKPLDDTQLRMKLAKQAAEQRYHDLTNKAFDAAQSNSDISKIAAILGIASKQTPLFAQSDEPLPWMHDKEVSAQLFGSDAVAAGTMAQPVAVSDTESVFFSISKRQPQYLPKLKDIHNEVATLARRAKAEVRLEQAAQKIEKSWQKDMPEDKELKPYHGSVETYANLRLGGANDSLSSDILSALFSQQKRIAVIKADNGDVLIARLNKISHAKVEDRVQHLFAQQWQSQSQLMASQGILNWLRKQADIQIMQDAVK